MIRLVPWTYEISTPLGKETVKGQSHGGLWGMHRRKCSDDKRWSITHIPTGLSATVVASEDDARFILGVIISVYDPGESRRTEKIPIPSCLREWLSVCRENRGTARTTRAWRDVVLYRAYCELSVAQFERIEDNDGERPSCVCDPGDPCPAHRAHGVLADIYEMLGELA